MSNNQFMSMYSYKQECKCRNVRITLENDIDKKQFWIFNPYTESLLGLNGTNSKKS